jgi:hypothetical protein
MNMIFGVGILGAFLDLVAQCFVRGVTNNLVYLIAAVIVSILLITILCNRFNLFRQFSWITVILVCDILFPLAFFLLGGILSGIPAYFVLSIVIIFLLTKGVQRLILLVSHIIIACSCYYISYLHPEWVAKLSVEQSYYDHIAGFLVCGLCIGIMIMLMRHMFETDRE